jgi:hypothetical protein
MREFIGLLLKYINDFPEFSINFGKSQEKCSQIPAIPSKA